MSERKVKGFYVYQPFGMQNKSEWAEGRIYGVAGFQSTQVVPTITGLTKEEAERIELILTVLHQPKRCKCCGQEMVLSGTSEAAK